MTPFLQVKNLHHTYSIDTPFEYAALKDVSFCVERGEFIGVIGHTGSGKSTLLQHLNGLLKPTSGEILFDGKDVIIKSKDEYDAHLDELLKTTEYDYEKERINDARDLYDETFFEESALIITRMITRGSGSIKLTVNNLYISGNKVYVVIRTDKPSMGTDDMQYAFFGFAVDKNEVANIDEVITLD